MTKCDQEWLELHADLVSYLKAGLALVDKAQRLCKRMQAGDRPSDKVALDAAMMALVYSTAISAMLKAIRDYDLKEDQNG